MMDNKELLSFAARAAGVECEIECFPSGRCLGVNEYNEIVFDPLTKDGDALWLAVKLRIDVTFNDLDVFAFPSNGSDGASETINVGDPYAATRRAIVRAAAEIGKEQS